MLLLGPQGAGKGTQAKRIAAEYGLPHIATGDILRRAMAEGTPLGLQVKPIYDSGDGFPRTFVQAEALDAMLREIDKQLDLVLERQVPDEVAVERLTKRAALEGRPDDTPEAIRRRLALYHEETEPLVEYYRSRGNVVGIHGDRSENEVFAEIQQALEQAGAVA